MDVDGVRGVTIGCEAPKLRLAEGDLEVNAVQVVLLPVDAGHPVETEQARRHGVREFRDRGQRCWDSMSISDLSRHAELKQVPPGIQVLQHDFGADW